MVKGASIRFKSYEETPKKILELLKLHNELKKYDKILWEMIGPEVETDYKLQKMAKRFPFLIDKLMAKASKDENFRHKIESLLPYTGGKAEMGSDKFIEELKGL